MELGKTIKIFRTGLEVKQSDFARKIGVSSNYLYMVESGKREPSLAFVKKAAQFLDVPVGLLFLGEDASDNYGTDAHKIYENIKSLIFKINELKHKSHEQPSPSLFNEAV